MQKEFVLKAKSAVKRVAAISAGAALTGASIFGAVAAADLGDYPTPFVSADGQLVGLVVVGADAAAADIVGAGDIISTLTQAAVSETDASTTTTTVSGGKSKDVNLGAAISADLGTQLDDDDVSGLQDTTVEFNSNTLNIHDVITLGGSAPIVHTSLSAPDDDYTSGVYIEATRRSIGYYYIIEEAVNLSPATEDVPLEIEFLGKTLKVTSITDADTLVAQVGVEYYMNIGESIDVAGKTVTLNDVSSTSVVVDVDGVTAVVGSSSKTVNGIKVEGQSFFSSDSRADRAATILVGSDTSKSYDDGDPYIGEPSSGYDWEWSLGRLTTTTLSGDTTEGSGGPTIGVLNYFVTDDFSDGPIGVGESYNLPNDFVSITFDSLTVDSYVDVTIDRDTALDTDSATTAPGGGNDDGNKGTSETALALVATGSDAFDLQPHGGGTRWNSTLADGSSGAITANTSTDKIWLVMGNNSRPTTVAHGADNVHIYYEDGDNKVAYAGNVSFGFTDAASGKQSNIAFIDYKDTSGVGDIEIAINSSGGNFTAQPELILVFQDENSNSGGSDIISNWSITVGTSSTFNRLGATASSADAAELSYGATNIGTKDEDHRTHYGIIIYDPKGNGGSDRVKMSIPGDVLEATMIVSGSGTSVSRSTTTTVNSVAGVSVIKLDTEVTDPASKNVVLVGGPAVNRLTAQALGLSYPTYGADSTIPEGKGLIQMVDNAFSGTNSALVVAGWDADDTRNAAAVLKDYASHGTDFAGQSAV